MKSGVDYPGVSVGTYCHDGQGNFLFHERGPGTRSLQGYWEVAGGEVEFGETLEQAALRELKEEYGCDGVIDEVLEANSYIKEEDGVLRHWVVHPFIVRIDPKAVAIPNKQEVSNTFWGKLDEAPTPLHPGVVSDLGQYADILQTYSQ